MIVSDSLVFGLTVPGTLAALAARLLRRAEERHPDPQAFEAKGGLDQMLTGLLTGTALIAFGVLTLAAAGIPLLIALIAAIMVTRAIDPGARLVPFYRYQIPLAAASLAAAVILLIATINTLQGVLNV